MCCCERRNRCCRRCCRNSSERSFDNLNQMNVYDALATAREAAFITSNPCCNHLISCSSDVAGLSFDSDNYADYCCAN